MIDWAAANGREDDIDDEGEEEDGPEVSERVGQKFPSAMWTEWMKLGGSASVIQEPYMQAHIFDIRLERI